MVYVKMVNSNADWQKGYRTCVKSTASEFARFHVHGNYYWLLISKDQHEINANMKWERDLLPEIILARH